MQWKKLGKIFDPTQHVLANNCVEFAQSPQALVFENFVRVFFSTREKDQTGKYLSHIAFVDFKKNFQDIVKLSSSTVITLGELGCFDEHGIFPLNVLRDGKKILGYIGGWSRRVSVPIETSIGLAISDDNGLTFQRMGHGPILTASLSEPYLIGDPFVAKFKNEFHMWYIYGTKWINHPTSSIPERVYKIGHAISADGLNWMRDGVQCIADRLNADECQALPTIMEYKDLYHMYFCYRQAVDFRNNKKRSYRIGYAYSKDLVSWTRDDNNAGIDVSDDGWDSDMICYPHIFQHANNVYLLYNGNEFGRFGFGLAMLQDSSTPA